MVSGTLDVCPVSRWETDINKLQRTVSDKHDGLLIQTRRSFAFHFTHLLSYLREVTERGKGTSQRRGVTSVPDSTPKPQWEFRPGTEKTGRDVRLNRVLGSTGPVFSRCRTGGE